MTVRGADCTKCGNRFRTDQPHREQCYTCSPARLKSPTVIPFQGSEDFDDEPPPFKPGRIEKTTVAKLERLGQLDTPDGALLERMARDLDGKEITGAARTSMSKQLSAALAEIEARVPAEKDIVDNWAERARKLREKAMGA